MVGRYKDGNWYHAIVGRKEGDSYVLIWDDGDKDDTLKGMDEVCAPPPLRRDGEYDEQQQAWRYLGFVIDCDSATDDDASWDGGTGAGCTRFIIWAAVSCKVAGMRG